MKKVLIIEDDHFSARRLKRLVMDIDDTIDVYGPLKSIMEVVAELTTNNNYDLIFSDIRLVDGDVFEAFKEVMPKSFVIFTTAYDEYAMEAIKNNGLDYLMKPIDADELRAAMNKLNLNYSTQQENIKSQLNGIFNAQFKQKQRKVKMREMNCKWLRMSNIS
jgi:two-component system, LytTR family, response regulator LytT